MPIQNNIALWNYQNRLLTVAPDALIFAYTMNADARDYSGNEHHGAPANVVYTETNPLGGSAAYFNGTNALITLPLTLSGVVNFDAFTFLCWFKPDATVWASINYTGMWTLGEDANNRYYQYHSNIANQFSTLGRRNNVNDILRTLTDAKMAGVWNRAVLTGSKAANLYRVYANNVQVGADGTLPSLYMGGVNTYRQIGFVNTMNYWKGGLWQFWCWNRMFSKAECEYIQRL